MGECPAASVTTAAIVRLSPRLSTAESGASVRLQDHGDTYSVAVAGVEREIVDRAHDCAERAEAAAVFAVLLLDPPVLDSNRSEKAVAPPPPRISYRGPQRRHLHIELGVAGLFLWAPGRDPMTGGAAIRLVLRGDHFGAFVGVEPQAPAVLDLGVARPLLWRVPVDVGLRAMARFRRAELGIDLAIQGGPLIVDSNDASARQTARLEVGARIAPWLQWWWSERWALLATVEGSIMPRTYAVELHTVGTIGNTPNAWLGVSLGVVAKIF